MKRRNDSPVGAMIKNPFILTTAALLCFAAIVSIIVAAIPFPAIFDNPDGVKREITLADALLDGTVDDYPYFVKSGEFETPVIDDRVMFLRLADTKYAYSDILFARVYVIEDPDLKDKAVVAYYYTSYYLIAQNVKLNFFDAVYGKKHNHYGAKLIKNEELSQGNRFAADWDRGYRNIFYYDYSFKESWNALEAKSELWFRENCDIEDAIFIKVPPNCKVFVDASNLENGYQIYPERNTEN